MGLLCHAYVLIRLGAGDVHNVCCIDSFRNFRPVWSLCPAVFSVFQFPSEKVYVLPFFKLCAGLEKHGLHRFMYLNGWSPRSGIIQKD